MWILKIMALILIFIAGALLTPLLEEIKFKEGSKGFFIQRIKKIANLFRKRKAKFEEQLVEGLDLISNSLKSGFSIFQALNLLTQQMPPPISQEFGIVLQEVKIGLSLEESLQNLAKRVKCEELDTVITAIEVAAATGGSLSESLSRVASTIRERKKIIEKIKALTSQGRMQALIVGLLPVLLCLIILTVDPQFILPLFFTPLGWIMLCIATGMEIIGIIIIRRIVMVDA